MSFTPTGPARLALCASFLTASSAAQATEWTTEPSFGLSHVAPLVHDAARGRTVMIRGAETWESDGVQWQLRAANGPFGASSLPALAYDERRGVVVMFDGGFLGRSANTWEWDGSVWTRAVTPAAPYPRWVTDITYDSRRGVVVLYGGESNGVRFGDTWEYDGANWTLRATANVPTSRHRHSIVFDSRRGVVVLFGGMDAAATTELDETWEYDGVDWVQRLPATRPTPRRNHGLAYDSARGRTVAYGGFGPGIDPRLTWEWDGSDWTSIQSPVQPAATLTTELAFDRTRGETVLVGAFGTDESLWAWDGQAWTATVDPPSPGGRDVHAMACDPDRGVVVMFGGEVGAGRFPTDGTWERRGGVWHRMTSPSQPPERGGHAMAFDPVARSVMLFGGAIPTALDDTWRWTGSAWSRVRPRNAPSPRGVHAMACDTGRNRVVLFGGRDPTGSWLDDTWEWDGADWTRRTPATVPPPRANHAMAYDPVRGRTVMFGGGDFRIGPSLGDHWEWDGVDWTRVTPATLPPTRAGHGMAFDEDRGVLVMTGGYEFFAPYFPVARADTWEWDGVDWTQQVTAVVPVARKHYRVAYDTTLRRIVMFGGDSLADTWTYGAARGTVVEPFGEPCAGSRGHLAVTARGAPSLGNRHFGLRVSSALEAVTVAVALSPDRASMPLPGGCTVYVRDPELCVAVTGRRGAVDLPLAIPNDPALHGADVFVQAIALDPRGPLDGVAALSGGLRLRLD